MDLNKPIVASIQPNSYKASKAATTARAPKTFRICLSWLLCIFINIALWSIDSSQANDDNMAQKEASPDAGVLPASPEVTKKAKTDSSAPPQLVIQDKGQKATILTPRASEGSEGSEGSDSKLTSKPDTKPNSMLDSESISKAKSNSDSASTNSKRSGSNSFSQIIFGEEAVFEKSTLFDESLTLSPEKPRNYLWPPLGSLLLPGLDQWLENQYADGFMYTSAALVGALIQVDAINRLVDESGNVNVNIADVAEDNDAIKQYLIGGSIYQTAGSLSAYHSFRTAVKSQKKVGGFKFLQNDEDASDLMMAPFQIEYFTRPTTYIPLGLFLGYVAIAFSESDEFIQPDFGNAFFASTISYGAGVGEEALFRGFLMPALNEKWQSPIGSNLATATVFSALHISEANRFPLPQFILGYYFGWLTQKNKWNISESIFIHTWWDIIAFSAITMAKNRNATYYSPLIHVQF